MLCMERIAQLHQAFTDCGAHLAQDWRARWHVGQKACQLALRSRMTWALLDAVACYLDIGPASAATHSNTGFTNVVCQLSSPPSTYNVHNDRISLVCVTPACACRYGRSLGSSLAPPAEEPIEQEAAEQDLAAAAQQRGGAPRQLSPRQRGLRRLLQQGAHQGAAAGGSRREPSPQHAAPQAPSGASAIAGEAGRGPGAEPGAEASEPEGQAPRPPPLPPPGVIACGGQQRLQSGRHGSVPQAVSPFAALATQAFDEAQEAGGSASCV